MKSRITLWGEEKETGKVLIALELLVKENMVKIYTFPESKLTEEFVEKLKNQWKAGEKLEFPEGHKVLDRPLSITDSLLPEELLVKDSDILDRAKTEWHFQVLSSKLSEVYTSELESIKDKVEKVENFSQDIWDELKNYWSKVQSQIRENNLLRKHAHNLRKETDGLFNALKEMRKKLNDEFNVKSKEAVQKFNLTLQKIETKSNKGDALRPLFGDLIKLQKELKNITLTRKDRDSLWKQIDTAFKTIKAKQNNGSESENHSGLSRVVNRMKGLDQAISRMEHSIKRDRSDLNFQNKRIDSTHGQLEAQIRQAKTMMLDQRISSKQKKLDELTKIKSGLEKKLEKEKLRAEKNKKREELIKAKQEIHKQHVKEIHEAEDERSTDKNIIEAAKKIAESKQLKNAKKTVEDVVEDIEDIFEETVQTIRSVTDMISDKLGTFMHSFEEE